MATPKATPEESKPLAVAPPAELPEWLLDTPEPEESIAPYVLLTRHPAQGWHLQTVEVTRKEFIALKRHLAAMRGLTVPAAVQ